MASEIDNAIVDLSYLFENRYGALWSGSADDFDRDGLRAKLRSWKVEIEAMNATKEEILGTANMLLRKSEYKDYPPSLNAFVNNIREFHLMFSRGEMSKYYIELKKVDEIFHFTYGRVWTESDQDKHRRKLEFWTNEMMEEGIEKSIIVNVAKQLRKKTEFRTYPPSLTHFLLECKFAALEWDISSPEAQFFAAAQGRVDELDFISEAVLSIVGTTRLKTQSDNQLRKVFVDLYYQQAQRFANDPTLLAKKDVKIIDEPKESDTINACPDFFKSFKL